MAGIKITDLPALSVADSADYLCIVDVSDTSASPAGTTKKIELSNVATSGVFYPIDDAVLSANVTSGGGSYGQYFVSGKSMTLGVYFQSLDIDFDADNTATILIELPTPFMAATASGSASILFTTVPAATATPVFSNCIYGGSGKVQITLQNYGGEVSDVYDVTATFVIELA
jgi:hypothetical protein